jgi:lysophospholipase L1-like esterase
VSFVKILLTSSVLMFVHYANAQFVTLVPGTVGSGLVCPAVKPKPVTPKPPSDGFVLEPPDDEEVASLNLSQANASKNEFSSTLLPRLKGNPLRVALWGDSHAAARFFSDELVKSFVSNPDHVLPTFIPPLVGRAGVRLPINKSCVGPSWKYEYAYRGSTSVNFARGLAKMTSDAPASYVWIDFSIPKAGAKLKSLNILYTSLEANPQVTVALSIDDGPEQELTLDKTNLGALKISSETNFSILKLRLVQGSISLDGFIPEYSKLTDVYFDTLGIPGATGVSWKNIDPQYFQMQGFGEPYDLVIFEYGTNEGNQRPFNLPAYSSNLRLQLANMRKLYPQSACILIGPTDRGVLLRRASKKTKKQPASPKELLTFSHVHDEISQTQRNIGREYDCLFWSWQDEMGGLGGAYRWLKRSPPLMARDLTHLTVDGYQQSARDFSKSFQLKDLGK